MTNPTITSMLKACNNNPERFLQELIRQRGALLTEVHTGLPLSCNQSPALRRTIRKILDEAIGPDPTWMRSKSGLLACFDGYVCALQEQYNESRERATDVTLLCDDPKFADLFDGNETVYARAVLDWCRTNLTETAVI